VNPARELGEPDTARVGAKTHRQKMDRGACLGMQRRVGRNTARDIHGQYRRFNTSARLTLLREMPLYGVKEVRVRRMASDGSI
jgi:hypothetical protein